MKDTTLPEQFEGFSFPAEPQSNSLGAVPPFRNLCSEDVRKSTHLLHKNDYNKLPISAPPIEPPHKVLKLGYPPGLSPQCSGSVSMQHGHTHMYQQQHLHEQHHPYQQPHVHHNRQLRQQHLYQPKQVYQPQPHQALHQLEASYYMQRERGQSGHNNAPVPLQEPIIQIDSRSYGANFQQESCISFSISPEAATREKPLLSCESVAEGYIADLSSLHRKGFCEVQAVAPSRTADQVKDHILAERKRREKLSERFIALSALLPGLKKMDKATILADAIKFVKELQEKLATLEEQATMSRSVTTDECQQHDIKVRIVGKSVLIRVYCEKIKGVLVRAMAELENLHLIVVNASILSFSDTAFDLTFSAQMEEGCDITTELIIRRLKDVLKKTSNYYG